MAIRCKGLNSHGPRLLDPIVRECVGSLPPHIAVTIFTQHTLQNVLALGNTFQTQTSGAQRGLPNCVQIRWQTRTID